LKIPKRTDPLAKFIRTGEGILVFAFNIALLIVPIVSSSLTAEQSAKWAAVIDGITVISRTGLKMCATAQVPSAPAPHPDPSGIGAAVTAGPRVSAIAAEADAAARTLPVLDLVTTRLLAAPSIDLADVGSLVSDAEEFASGPSSPDPEPRR
jgi:hypothetical protein